MMLTFNPFFPHSDISNNAVTSLPDGFATLSSLTRFDASNNSLTGVVPPSLFSSQSIVNINLANNQLSGNVNINASKLFSASLQHNHLISIEVSNAARLSKVYLAYNQFGGNLPDLSSSTNLTTLDASYNKSVDSKFAKSELSMLTQIYQLVSLSLLSKKSAHSHQPLAPVLCLTFPA